MIGLSLDEIARLCGYAGFDRSAQPSVGLRNLVVLSSEIQKSRKYFSALVNALDGVENRVAEELEELAKRQVTRRRGTRK